MAGKIKSQIDYVSRGFDVIINFMEMLSAGIVIIINVVAANLPLGSTYITGLLRQ